MSESKIQLGKFLKNENWEFHFALQANPEPSWIACFREVCAETRLDADIKAFSIVIEPEKQNYFALIVGGISDSESQLRAQLLKAIDKTNKKFNDYKCELMSELK